MSRDQNSGVIFPKADADISKAAAETQSYTQQLNYHYVHGIVADTQHATSGHKSNQSWILCNNVLMSHSKQQQHHSSTHSWYLNRKQHYWVSLTFQTLTFQTSPKASRLLLAGVWATSSSFCLQTPSSRETSLQVFLRGMGSTTKGTYPWLWLAVTIAWTDPV